MARLTDGTDDYLELIAVPAMLTGTMACRYRPANNTTTGALMAIGDHLTACRHQLLSAGAVAGDPLRAQTVDTGGIAFSADIVGGVQTGVWAHGCMTFSALARSVFLNGGSKVTESTPATVAGFTRTTIGARWLNNVRGSFFFGRICEPAIWDVVLSDDEVLGLASMQASPLDWRRSSLVFYAPLWGNVSPEPELIGGVGLTVSGAVRADHAPIVPHWARRKSYFVFGPPPGITSAHIASAAQMFAASVALTVAGATIPSNATATPPSVSPLSAVTGVHLTSTATTYPPSLAPRVEMPSIPSAATLLAPVVAPGPIGVVSAHLASAATVHTPTIGGLSMDGAFIAPASTLASPTLGVGPVGLLGSHIPTTIVLHSPTVGAGATPVVGAFLPSTALLYAAMVAPGEVTVLGATIAASSLAFAATVTPEGGLSTATIPSTALLFVPLISPSGIMVVGATIPSVALVLPPGVAAGAVALMASHIASTVVLLAPAALSEGDIGGATIPSGAALFALSLSPGPIGLIGATISAGAVVLAPGVGVGPVVLAGPFLASGTIVLPPSVATGATAITGGTIASSVALFALDVRLAKLISTLSFDGRYDAELTFEGRYDWLLNFEGRTEQ